MNNFIDFFIEVGKLKRMKRKGWVINQIKNAESIAEHSFRVAHYGWLLARQKRKFLNIESFIKMALFMISAKFTLAISRLMTQSFLRIKKI